MGCTNTAQGLVSPFVGIDAEGQVTLTLPQFQMDDSSLRLQLLILRKLKYFSLNLKQYCIIVVRVICYHLDLVSSISNRRRFFLDSSSNNMFIDYLNRSRQRLERKLVSIPLFSNDLEFNNLGVELYQHHLEFFGTDNLLLYKSLGQMV